MQQEMNELSFFNDMPQELIALIASFLKKRDIIFFSQSNKQAAAAVYHLLKREKNKLVKDFFFAAGDRVTYFYTPNCLYVCGKNLCGQLGVGDKKNRYNFTKVSLDKEIGSIKQVTGSGNTTFILTDKYLLACGRNIDGELGVGDTSSRENFVKVPLEIKVDQIESIIPAYRYTLIFTKNREFFCSGFSWSVPDTPHFKSLNFEKISLENKIGQIEAVKPDGLNCSGYFFITDRGCFSRSLIGFLSFHRTQMDLVKELFLKDRQNHGSKIIQRIFDNYFQIDFTETGLYGVGVNDQGQLAVGETIKRKSSTRIENLPAELNLYYKIGAYLKKLEKILGNTLGISEEISFDSRKHEIKLN